MSAVGTLGFWVLGALFLNFLVRLGLALSLPIVFQEAHYWEWSRYPSLGYLDQPPLIAWIGGIFERVFRTGPGPGLRIASLLLGTGVFGLIYRIGIQLLPGRDAALRALFFALAVPGTTPTDAFRRGDVNDDARVDISDGVGLLGFLFLGGSAPGCTDAADANDSGDVGLSDAIFIFGFLFLGGDPPPAPGPVNCGPDPDGSVFLGCESYESC